MEIYCQTGRRNVVLPDEVSQEFVDVTISPCEGCKHPYHLKQLERIQKDIEGAELVKLKAVSSFSHMVGVSQNPSVSEYNNAVICTCNCCVKYPDWKLHE